MARKDVTGTECVSFRELCNQLQEEGFDVDHFHAVEYVEVTQEELVRRMGDNSSIQRAFFQVEEECLTLFRDWVSHLNLDWEGGLNARWDTGDGHDAIEDDPRGWDKLVADEWHG